MKAPTSLARSLSHVSNAVGSTSRIPHLRAHILRRQRVKATASTVQIQKRASHSAVLEPPSFSPFTHRSETTDEPEPRFQFSSERQPEAVQGTSFAESFGLDYDRLKEQTVDYEFQTQTRAETFESLLEDDLPERTFFWLSQHPDGRLFTDTASDEDFARLFASVDPNVIFSAFKLTTKSLQFAKHDLGDVVLHDRSLVKRLRLFLPLMHKILRQREEAGWPITLDLCRHALKCCAAVGDRKAALAIVSNLVPAFRIEMDLECYNYLMEVQITNLSNGSLALSGQAFNSHVFNLRSRVKRPPSVRGYMLSSEDPEPSHTLRGLVLQTFQTITQKGLPPSEQTFVNLILALAKSGDVTGVDSILKSVWNIDVHALGTFDEEEIESPTFYEENHPLRPSSSLLYAIVHAYGLNKDQDKAASLLDYTSRNYAIDIPLAVWEELFTWTYANNLHKSATRRDQGQASGSRSSKDVELLYKKVTDVPYNLDPSPRILDLLTRSFRTRHYKDECFDAIRKIKDQAGPMVDHLQDMIENAKALKHHPSLMTPDGMISKELFIFRRDFQFAFLQVLAQLTMMRRNIKRAVTDRDWSGFRSWSHRGLPDFIGEFYDHLPHRITYRTPTGSVEITRHFGAKEHHPFWLTLNQASLFWDAIAAPDPADIPERLASVPDDLMAAAMTPFGKAFHFEARSSANKAAESVLAGFEE